MHRVGLVKRAGWTWAALLAVVGLSFGCEQFDPVHTDNLCDRRDGHSISMRCPQCSKRPPIAENCSQCRAMTNPDPELCEQQTTSSPSSSGVDGAGSDGGDPPSESGDGGEAGAGGDTAEAGSGGMSRPESGAGGGAAIDPNRCVDDLWCRAIDATRPGCDQNTHQCVECTLDLHCVGDQRVCNTLIHRCQNCVHDDDCEDRRCDEMLNVCVDCERDQDCTGEVDNQCDTRAHACVDCVTDAGCAGNEVNGTCHEPTFKCVDCLKNADCNEDGKPICDEPSRTCVPCLRNEDCTGPLNDNCDTVRKVCVDCIDNSGCRQEPNTQCAGEKQVCVECLRDADCPSGHCIEEKCVECRVDADCPNAIASHCDPAKHECVGCTSNTHCAHLDDTPACNGGTCVECNDDLTCNGKACLRAQHLCSDVGVRSLDTCIECQADSMCKANMWCVRLQFGSMTYGNYCVYSRASRSGGSCSSARPYSRMVANTRSVDGMSQSYCVPPSSTTCEGVLHASIGGGISCADDPGICGVEGVFDAVCNDNKRCTYVCADRTNSSDCPSNQTCLDNSLCGFL